MINIFKTYLGKNYIQIIENYIYKLEKTTYKVSQNIMHLITIT